MDAQLTYQATAFWALHHRGVVKADSDNPYILDFTTPPEFGGEARLWTPQHFLLAALASDYVATFRELARNSHLEFQVIETTVVGHIDDQPGGRRFTRIMIRPELTLCREEDRHRGHFLLAKAERSSMVAHSLASSIAVEEKIEFEEPALV